MISPLPLFRTDPPLRAFSKCSMDFGGPIETRAGRGKTRNKRYFLLFTCPLSRAIHNEMCTSLDTDAVINALFRFTSRRGVPVELYSDNGRSFVAANKELKEEMENVNWDRVKQDMFQKGLGKWHFSAPYSPHMNGLTERLVASVKKALKTTVGMAGLTDEELTTVLIQIEGLLNARPLKYVGDDLEDETALTPNNFLFGQAGGELAPRAAEDEQKCITKRWRKIQQYVSHSWKRWKEEYLPSLNKLPKWRESLKDLQEGEIVAVADRTLPRFVWPKAKVEAVYKSRDGHVRKVDLLCHGKSITRSVHQILPLNTVCGRKISPSI